MNNATVPIAATPTKARQARPGSRPSGNSSSATGRKNVRAGAQVASVSMARSRQNGLPASARVAFSSSAYPVAEAT